MAGTVSTAVAVLGTGPACSVSAVPSLPRLLHAEEQQRDVLTPHCENRAPWAHGAAGSCRV